MQLNPSFTPRSFPRSFALIPSPYPLPITITLVLLIPSEHKTVTKETSTRIGADTGTKKQGWGNNWPHESAHQK